MILHEDPHTRYWYPLTSSVIFLHNVIFAIDPFIKNKDRDCVIKQNLETKRYAVFTRGDFVDDIEVRKIDKMKADAHNWIPIKFVNEKYMRKGNG